MGRCAGAGREHSQAASPSWLMEIFYTIEVTLSLQMGVDQGAGTFPSHFHEFKSSLVWECKLFQEFRKIHFLQFHNHCSGTGHQVVRKTVLYIAWFAYSLLSSSSLVVVLVFTLLPY